MYLVIDSSLSLCCITRILLWRTCGIYVFFFFGFLFFVWPSTVGKAVEVLVVKSQYQLCICPHPLVPIIFAKLPSEMISIAARVFEMVLFCINGSLQCYFLIRVCVSYHGYTVLALELCSRHLKEKVLLRMWIIEAICIGPVSKKYGACVGFWDIASTVLPIFSVGNEFLAHWKRAGMP